jgi:hypothetical protein
MTDDTPGAAAMTDTPRRLQRLRVKGWRKPEGAVIVDRGSRWGNPFIIGRDGDRETVVAKYRQWATDPNAQPISYPTNYGGTRTIAPPVQVGLERLRGRDLYCACRPDELCHADVLLELANGRLP